MDVNELKNKKMTLSLEILNSKVSFFIKSKYASQWGYDR